MPGKQNSKARLIAIIAMALKQKKNIFNMTVLPCVHHFLNLKLLSLHFDFAMHRHSLMMFLIFLCSAVLDTACIP